MTETHSSKEPIVIEQPFQLLQLSIDPASGTILGPAGTEQLDPKVMSVLLLLAQHSPKLVTREQLFDKIWCDRIVGDETLTQCVYQLRQHLVAASGDLGYRKLIVTLPKRGYRLDADIKACADVTDADKKTTFKILLRPRQLLLLLGIFIGCYLTVLWLNSAPIDKLAAHSIAVLPFADFSPSGDQAYLADGLAEELIDRLTRIPDLRVIARTSSFSFRDKAADISEIARKLDVGFLLEGSVRKDANRIRITLQLIETSSNSHVWSNSYDRELKDILDVQSEIAAGVADALHLTLADAPGKAVPPPVAAPAYESYLLGRFFFNRRASGDVERSEQHYRKAVEIDPGFAQAWVGLAAVYQLYADDRTKMLVWVEKMGMALEQALRLDPELPEAHARAAVYYSLIGDQDQLERHWQLALQFGSEDILIVSYSAHFALVTGDYQRVLELSRKTLQLDPLSATAHDNHGYYLLADGHFQAALAAFALAEQLNPELNTKHAMLRTLILVLTGEHEQALARALAWPQGPDREHILAQSHHALDQHEAAAAAEHRLLSRSDSDSALRMAEIEAVRGHADAAFEWLEQIHLRETAVEKTVVWPSWDDRVRLSPSLRGLRNDPRWEEAIQILPQYQPIDIAVGRLEYTARRD